MDEENVRARRSSILKLPKFANAADSDDTEILFDIEKPIRRVSFASSNFIKPFATDNDKLTVWDTTYEEAADYTDTTPPVVHTTLTHHHTSTTNFLQTCQIEQITNNIVAIVENKENLNPVLYNVTSSSTYHTHNSHHSIIDYMKRQRTAREQEASCIDMSLTQNLRPAIVNDSDDMEMTCDSRIGVDDSPTSCMELTCAQGSTAAVKLSDDLDRTTASQHHRKGKLTESYEIDQREISDVELACQQIPKLSNRAGNNNKNVLNDNDVMEFTCQQNPSIISNHQHLLDNDNHLKDKIIPPLVNLGNKKRRVGPIVASADAVASSSSGNNKPDVLSGELPLIRSCDNKLDDDDDAMELTRQIPNGNNNLVEIEANKPSVCVDFPTIDCQVVCDNNNLVGELPVVPSPSKLVAINNDSMEFTCHQNPSLINNHQHLLDNDNHLKDKTISPLVNLGNKKRRVGPIIASADAVASSSSGNNKPDVLCGELPLIRSCDNKLDDDDDAMELARQIPNSNNNPVQAETRKPSVRLNFTTVKCQVAPDNNNLIGELPVVQSHTKLVDTINNDRINKTIIMTDDLMELTNHFPSNKLFDINNKLNDKSDILVPPRSSNLGELQSNLSDNKANRVDGNEKHGIVSINEYASGGELPVRSSKLFTQSNNDAMELTCQLQNKLFGELPIVQSSKSVSTIKDRTKTRIMTNDSMELTNNIPSNKLFDINIKLNDKSDILVPPVATTRLSNLGELQSNLSDNKVNLVDGNEKRGIVTINDYASGGELPVRSSKLFTQANNDAMELTCQLQNKLFGELTIQSSKSVDTINDKTKTRIMTNDSMELTCQIPSKFFNNNQFKDKTNRIRSSGENSSGGGELPVPSSKLLPQDTIIIPANDAMELTCRQQLPRNLTDECKQSGDDIISRNSPPVKLGDVPPIVTADLNETDLLLVFEKNNNKRKSSLKSNRTSTTSFHMNFTAMSSCNDDTEQLINCTFGGNTDNFPKPDDTGLVELPNITAGNLTTTCQNLSKTRIADHDDNNTDNLEKVSKHRHGSSLSQSAGSTSAMDEDDNNAVNGAVASQYDDVPLAVDDNVQFKNYQFKSPMKSIHQNLSQESMIDLSHSSSSATTMDDESDVSDNAAIERVSGAVTAHNTGSNLRMKSLEYDFPLTKQALANLQFKKYVWPYGNACTQKQYNIGQLQERARQQRLETFKFLTEFKVRSIEYPKFVMVDEELDSIDIENDLGSVDDVGNTVEQPEQMDLSIKEIKSLDDKIQEAHERCKDYWNLEKKLDGKYYFSTLFGTLQFVVEFNDNGIISNLVLNEDIASNSSPLVFFIFKQFHDRLGDTHLKHVLGRHYDILSLLDYVHITMQEMVQFFKEFGHLAIVDLEMDKDFNASFKVLNVNLTLWSDITVKMAECEKIQADDIVVSMKYGKCIENHVKKLAENCPNGINFIISFVKAIQSYVALEVEKRKCM